MPVAGWGRRSRRARNASRSVTVSLPPCPGTTPPRKPTPGARWLIDFSSAAAIETILHDCRQTGTPLVIGTTGHTAAQRALIGEAAKEIAIVFAANFSVGVNTLFWLTRQAAQILGPDFDLEIVEVHHRLKKDAPSGTARRLAEILAEARGLDYDADARHGREGSSGRGARARSASTRCAAATWWVNTPSCSPTWANGWS